MQSRRWIRALQKDLEALKKYTNTGGHIMLWQREEGLDTAMSLRLLVHSNLR
jgi:hypothetical protein